MSITRDPDYPAEYAALMQAFNQVADGFSANAVRNAALQMVAAAIGFDAKAHGLSLAQTMEHAETVFDCIRSEVRDNWLRVRQASDVEVKPQ